MIIIETKIKSIPSSCKECKFCKVEDSSRICVISGAEVPYEFVKEKRNYAYTKCKKCPLKVVE